MKEDASFAAQNTKATRRPRAGLGGWSLSSVWRRVCRSFSSSCHLVPELLAQGLDFVLHQAQLMTTEDAGTRR